MINLKIYSITHSSDLDGMASAALLVHYYKMPIQNLCFTNYSGRIYRDTLDFISNIKGSGNLLVISDFGMIDDNLKSMGAALSKFRKKGNYTIWLDHHIWDNRAVEGISKFCDLIVVGENLNFCGTELVYKFLCKKSKFGDELARITHLSDFALASKSKKENHLIDKIAYGIKELGTDNATNPETREFVSCLAKGDIDCKIINDAYEKYMKRSRPFLKKVLSTAKIIEVNKVRIAVSFGIGVSSQEACMTMISKLKTDIAIYVGIKEGHSSIRSVRDSKSWGVDSSEIANAFLGGGHPLASGFSLESSGYDLSDKGAQSEIIEKIRKISEKLYSKKIKYYQQDTGKFAKR